MPALPENASEITNAGRSATGSDISKSPTREALGGAVTLRLAVWMITAMSHEGRKTDKR